ncbi:hypothetical protein BSKO_02976 [Bryopsis sp. KO-2023]|nr:hypothetical protein BSKO_02976 [Bryopsis sp. KO-2023]
MARSRGGYSLFPLSAQERFLVFVNIDEETGKYDWSVAVGWLVSGAIAISKLAFKLAVLQTLAETVKEAYDKAAKKKKAVEEEKLRKEEESRARRRRLLEKAREGRKKVEGVRKAVKTCKEKTCSKPCRCGHSEVDLGGILSQIGIIPKASNIW